MKAVKPPEQRCYGRAGLCSFQKKQEGCDLCGVEGRLEGMLGKRPSQFPFPFVIPKHPI